MQNHLKNLLDTAYRMDETHCVEQLLAELNFTAPIEQKIERLANELVTAVRENKTEHSGIEALMMQYDLSTDEGVLLMCLAESLLRIPDAATEKLLIRDKLTGTTWDQQIECSESAFTSMAAWGLALSGRILKKPQRGFFKKIWHALISRSSEPVIRVAIRQAMKLLGEHFVLGQHIEEALERSIPQAKRGYTFSYDMLGEVARTQADADRYFAAYAHAIETLGHSHTAQHILYAPSISVKLSALHPRYEYTKRESVVPELSARLKELALLAKANRIGMAIDAEEADRLDLSLDIFEELFKDPAFSDWAGLGMAVQAYQKRAMPLLDWLIALARSQKRRIPVRLVKGAYWDSEIKMTQVLGLENYPVFTRKVNTDISYLACAKKMLTAPDALDMQFATHNAYSIAAILTLLEEARIESQQPLTIEFQNLQGMGKALHDHLVTHRKLPCRIYAPVGSYEDLLPYLVRRLLENGANSSFVHRMIDRKTPLSDLIESPMAKLRSVPQIPNPNIPLPKNIFYPERINSSGIDFSNLSVVKNMMQELKTAELNNKNITIRAIDSNEIDEMVQRAHTAYTAWDARSHQERADILRKAADLLEMHRAQLFMLIVREGGRTLLNSVSEVREAIDFCRYYAAQAEYYLSPQSLPGYTGESDVLQTHGRGVILCISPWNFPVAIFTGQIAAALVTGNAVLAKPAGATPKTAALVVQLFHEAGVPVDILQLIVGRGSVLGPLLLQNPLVNGVVFTGSDATAKSIQQTLAARPGAIASLIAETGGINAMIADSSALPEQLVRDVITSAFDSAGQRCSALRVLFVQQDIAEDVIRMLQGAMAEITVGDPVLLSTDVGPVIDRAAQKTLQDYEKFMQQNANLIYKVALPEHDSSAYYIAPQAYELPDLRLVTREVFGPVLHVIRYARKDLDAVIDAINHLGYGLTFGIHSRIDATIDHIASRIKAGNIYVNRNMIGAVVGVQPFGGRGLSGTGPKVGGPHYLSAFCTETTLTIDTTAAGGNASLLAMDDEE